MTTRETARFVSVHVAAVSCTPTGLARAHYELSQLLQCHCYGDSSSTAPMDVHNDERAGQLIEAEVVGADDLREARHLRVVEARALEDGDCAECRARRHANAPRTPPARARRMRRAPQTA